MRPRIIEILNGYFNTDIFRFIIPDPAVIYAIMLGVGIIIYIRRCDKTGLSRKHSTGIALWVAISAMLGARIFYLLQNIGDVINNPLMLLQLNGATVSFGVYLGGIFGMLAYYAIHKIPVLIYADVIASVLGIGPMIGRMACFLNGCDYGTVTGMPWAVRFPKNSYAYVDHLHQGWISGSSELSLTVHPVQFYSMLKGLVLFILFSYLWKKGYFKPGVLFFLFWVCYGMLRFIIEFFRGDMNRGWVGNLSTGQFMSILLISVSLFFISVIYRWKIIRVPVKNNR